MSRPVLAPRRGAPVRPLRAACVRAALLVGTLAATATACDRLRPPTFHGAAVEPPGSAPALRLPRAAAPGDTFDLARATADSGRAALVFFGYTHCPDVCPTTLHDWVHVKRALGPDSARVRFLFVTVDPERDTPAVVARYVADVDGDFVGLAGTRADVDAVQRAWGVASFREGGDDGAYTVAHPAQLFAVDAEGRLRLTYSLGARPADVAADLRRLVR
jgi:protein SCO1/2